MAGGRWWRHQPSTLSYSLVACAITLSGCTGSLTTTSSTTPTAVAQTAPDDLNRFDELMPMMDRLVGTIAMAAL